LILQGAVARSPLRRAAELLEGRDPAEVVEVMLATAWQILRAGPDNALCDRLGITHGRACG
jgi:hypothetical protein